MIYLGVSQIPVSALRPSAAPDELMNIWAILCRVFAIPDAAIYFIPSKVIQIIGSLVHVGELGYADIPKNICYVLESDDGLLASMATMIHEFRHLIDGPHPWPEETTMNES